ncbi:hypothetical protein ACP70R_001604 [Stipagrostis hirtigluma subsp. patula]
MARNTAVLLVLTVLLVQLISVVPPSAASRALTIQQAGAGSVPNGGTRRFLGVVDGSLNNADVIDHIELLNTNINSDPSRNMNSKANSKSTRDEEVRT